MDRDPTAAFRFPAVFESLSAMRRLLRQFLSEQSVGVEAAEQVVLVAHELAANVVEHAAEAGDDFSLKVVVDRDDVLISVHTTSAHASEIRPKDPGADAERGRGMLIVDSIAYWEDQVTGAERVITARVPTR